MTDHRHPRTSIGLALLVSSAVVLVIAALAGAGVLPLGADVRPAVSAALVVVAVLDLLIGLWFLRRGR